MVLKELNSQLILVSYFFFAISAALVSISIIVIGAPNVGVHPLVYSLFLVFFLSWGCLVRKVKLIPNISIGNFELAAFCIFILGRFWVVFLNSDYNPFCLDFFAKYCLGPVKGLELFSWVVLFFSGREIGYLVEKKRPFLNKMRLNNFVDPDIVSCGTILCILLIGTILSIVYFTHAFSLSKYGGYLALYDSQNKSYSLPTSLIATTLNAMALGLSSAFSHRRLFICGLILFGVNSILMLVMGGRAGFFSYVLFLVFVNYLRCRKDWPILKVFFCLALLGLFIQWVIAYSPRGGDLHSSLYQIVVNNLDSQGVSLMVFDLSTKAESYPSTIFLKYLMPTSLIVFLRGSDIPTYLTSFGHYLSYYSNRLLYSAGYGLGWTLMGDLFLFSLRNPGIFFLLALFYGRFLRWIDRGIKHSKYIRGLGITLLPSILLLPRASFSSISQMFVLYTVGHFGIVFLRSSCKSCSEPL